MSKYVAVAAGVVSLAALGIYLSKAQKSADEKRRSLNDEKSTSSNVSKHDSSHASATSKVLLTGGYLILEAAYPGLVIGLSARFHTDIIRLKSSSAASASDNEVSITVYAPQRSTEPLRYTLSCNPNGSKFELKAGKKQEKNKFVELSIIYSLLFLAETTSVREVLNAFQPSTLFYLEGDYQFYSATPPSIDANSTVPPVVPDGSKTGLGSSAALVSSLVAAVFFHCGALQKDKASSSSSSSSSTPFLSLPYSERLGLCHNLAQLIHCAAQGKVGSGFDVATAFNGSNVYQRFQPAVIENMLGQVAQGATASPDASVTSIAPKDLVACIRRGREESKGWNHSVKPFSLPPGLSLLLGDVAGGASTPVMVKKVLEWRSDLSRSTEIWESLARSNKEVQTLLEELSAAAKANPKAYNATRLKLAQRPASEWEVVAAENDRVAQLFFKLSSTFKNVRHFLRAMGTAAQVDIEPPEQQQLLDATILIPGVVLAGVPGAGGDDAIFALLIDESVSANVQSKWSDFRFSQAERRVTRLPVAEEKDTIIVEKRIKDVIGWNI